MSISRKTIELIASRAQAFSAHVRDAGQSSLSVELSLKRADGRKIPYNLHISVDGFRASVREAQPTMLPAFCPERHINKDGSFCLYWQDETLSKLDSLEAVDKWWGTLVGFLRLQERASRKRSWPNGHAWAHGTAAIYQQEAEQLATQLSADISTRLNRGNFRVERQTSGDGVQKNGPILRIYCEESLFFSVWERQQRVVGLRQPCLCGVRGRHGVRRLGRCANHAKAAASLGIAIYKKQLEEERFWESLKETACCGTMENCPLKIPA